RGENWFMKTARMFILVSLVLLAASLLLAAEQTENQNEQNAKSIADLKAARTLMLQRDELARVYGTYEDEEVRELTASFNRKLRQAAHNFPLLDPGERPSTNRFSRLVLNRDGARLDGFRF